MKKLIIMSPLSEDNRKIQTEFLAEFSRFCFKIKIFHNVYDNCVYTMNFSEQFVSVQTSSANKQFCLYFHTGLDPIENVN